MALVKHFSERYKMENVYKYGASTGGGYQCSFAFTSKEELYRWIAEDFEELKKKHSNLTFSTFKLDGLNIGDSCHVRGDADEVYKIVGIKMYSKDRPGFILDSGFCEEVVKCYKVKG